MRELLLAALLGVALLGGAGVRAAGQGLVTPQTDCKIRCENGGMCVFELDRPHVHSCICLLGVFHGDRCQFAVATETAPEDLTPTLQPHTHHPHHHRGHRVDDEREREEERRRVEEERKRAYERKVNEQQKERERQDEQRRAEAARNDAARVEATRREAERQETERRRHEERLEQRRRHEEMIAEQRRQQETADLDRRANEQREQERLRKEKEDEEKRRREMEGQQERDNWETKAKQQREEKLEKQAEAANEDWEYKTDDDDEDYISVPEAEAELQEIEKEETAKVAEHVAENNNIDNVAMKEEEVESTTTTTTTQNPEEKLNDENLLASISGVLEKAIEKTLEEHPVESSEDDQNNEDYWDHTPKKTDEEYANEAESKRLDKPSTTTPDVEYGMDEGQEGWMMVRAEKPAESSASRWTGCFSVFLSVLFLVIFM